mgnify:FL=1
MTDANLQSIAVFGGSFDPVHNGHVMIARSALAELELDRLIVMPAAQSPFKPDQALAPAAARMEMLRAAFSGEPEIEISSWELDRGGVSYSIETLRALAAEHPEAQLFYLIGADHVATLPQWREADALAAAATFVVVPRPGAPEEVFPQPFSGRYLQGKPMAISASEIRDRLRAGRSVANFVPPPVAQLLNSMQIYSEN